MHALLQHSNTKTEWRMTMTDENIFEQAVNDSTRNFVDELTEAFAKIDDESLTGREREEVKEELREMPLSVMVRDGWREPGKTSDSPEEFEILLGTGVPARRVIGKLDKYNEPLAVRYQYRDWFQPWTDGHFTGKEYDLIRRFASLFYYGE
jgi:hypothetical protein